MGFFSFTTCDTQESIANVYSNHKNAKRTIYLLQYDGSEPIPIDGYEGYGTYGNINAYAWIGKHNIEQAIELLGLPEKVRELDLFEDTKELHGIGLKLFNNHLDQLRYPLKFSYNKDANWHDYEPSRNDPAQGFFLGNSIEL
ncbi:hypothetical protein [Vibrio gangliei]|uniref:hypothetical protein n=1 Tax=Vibrio gangliei TaxID=2077090 RepID=UPI000D0190DF|nr:hypothetical protein [Vibrio gangliei]